MLIFIVCAIALTSAAPQNNDHLERGRRPVYSLGEAPALFGNFIKEYNKNYDPKEREERFQIFLTNLKEINYLNEKSSHATYSINKFSDLTKEEFTKYYTGLKVDENFWNNKNIVTDVSTSFNFTAPDSFDWRQKGVVSRVKNQGRCGSCWAFSASGNVESIYAIKTGQLTDISEQQLVDCDTQEQGCQGGWPEKAISYFVQYGAMSLQSYPYTATQGSCNYRKSGVVARISNVKHNIISEDQMKEMLHSTGPLSICIAANQLSSYSGGVIVQGCGDPNVDHAVLLVGYGNEQGVDYWLIKNSWGESWGEGGYFKIQRGVNCLQIANYGATTAVV